MDLSKYSANYQKVFQKVIDALKETDLTNQEAVIEAIKGLDERQVQFRNNLIPAITYLKSLNLDTDKLQMEKEGAQEGYMETKEQKTQPTFEECMEKLDGITDIRAKLILSLYLNLDYVLRSDMFLMKFRNYTENDHYYLDGVFHIKKSVKRKLSYEIPLPLEIDELLKEVISQNTSDYIFDMDTFDDKNRSINATKTLNSLTKKYFEVKLGINDMRKIAVSHMEEEIRTLPAKEQAEKRKEKAQQMGHSVSTQQEYYNKGDASLAQEGEDAIDNLLAYMKKRGLKSITLNL
jgi:integrase